MHSSEIEGLRALVTQGVLTEAEFVAITTPNGTSSAYQEPDDGREPTLRMTIETLLSSAASSMTEADPSRILSAHLLQVLKSERLDNERPWQNSTGIFELCDDTTNQFPKL